MKQIYKFSWLGVVAAGVMLLGSCNSESEAARAARKLFEQAQAQNLAGEPAKALELLDSLQSDYKEETQWQREALKFRPTVMINLTQQAIIAVDDSIAMYEKQYGDIMPSMKLINDARLVEPYYVDAATYNPQFFNTTGLQPRVSEIGQLYFVSSVNPGGLKHTGFTLSCNGETIAVGPVPYDGESNYRIDGSEVVTYSPDQSQPAGEFAANHAGQSVTLILTGGKSRQIKLTDKQLNAIINCKTMSDAIVKARQLSFNKERLQRQLAIAQSQAERLAGKE